MTVNEQVVWERSREYGSPGKQGRLKLAAGTHPFEIQYFQGPRYEIALQWFYQPPNGHRQIVPPKVIYRPGKPRVPNALKKLQQRLKVFKKSEIYHTKNTVRASAPYECYGAFKIRQGYRRF